MLFGEVAASAAYALGKMGESAKAAVPALQRAERHDSLIVRAAAMFSLWKIQPDRPVRRIKAAALLTKAMDDERSVIRAGAAFMMGQLDKPGAQAKAKLKMLRDNDDDELVRKAAAEALEKLNAT